MFLTMKSRAVGGFLTLALAMGCSGQPSTSACSHAAGGAESSEPCVTTGGNTSTGGSTSTGGQATGGTKSSLPFPTLDFTCATDADCCVVEYACYNKLYLVTKAQQAEMNAYVASLSSPYCTACITPDVQVSCKNHQCVGEVVGSGTYPSKGLNTTHCGALPLSGTGGRSSAVALAVTTAADAGTPQKTIFGCGSY